MRMAWWLLIGFQCVSAGYLAFMFATAAARAPARDAGSDLRPVGAGDGALQPDDSAGRLRTRAAPSAVGAWIKRTTSRRQNPVAAVIQCYRS